MNISEKLRLIEGSFENDEANELLVAIFSYKINFYKLKNLGFYARYGSDSDEAQQNIIALTNEMQKLQSLLAAARAQNKKLSISSQVLISVSDHE